MMPYKCTMMHCMDESAEMLARAIGARVNQERKGRGWTLDQLAAFAGVSRRMLVNVEYGSVNPSVGTLLRLSDALGVGLPALVEPPAPRGAKLTRAGEGPQGLSIALAQGTVLSLYAIYLYRKVYRDSH